jgi:hypothetical protein
MDLIHEYLVHSYLYYCLADTLISDYEFDDLCKTINKNWETLDSEYKQFLLDNNETPGLIKGLELFQSDYPVDVLEDAQLRLAKRDCNG